MKIKAVFFDVGETLLYRNPSLTTIAYRFLKKQGIRKSKKQIDILLKKSAEEMQPIVKKAKLSDSEKWELFVKRFFKKVKFDNLDRINKIKEKFKKGTSFRKFKDVDKIFTFLKKNRIKIGVISNAPKELRDILKRTGLLSRIDFLFISEEIGFEKPDKKIFEYAVKSADVNKKECIFIGDNYIADIQGAKNAGIFSLWLDRNSSNTHFSYKDSADKNVFKIKKLTELIKFIKKGK